MNPEARAGAVPLPAQAHDGSKEFDVALTKLSNGESKRLFKKDGIEIHGVCHGSFVQTDGLCSEDDFEPTLPDTGDKVAQMFIRNVSASNATAAFGGADTDWGICHESDDYKDRHIFGIGQELNIVVSSVPGGLGDDIAGAEGTGGSMGFVYQSNGASVVVEDAVAGVNVLGKDCVFAVHGLVREGRKGKD